MAVTKMNDLKKGLVITTGDNYVGSAEPELSPAPISENLTSIVFTFSSSAFNSSELPILVILLLCKTAILELHREKDDRGILSDFRFGKIRNLQMETQYSQKKKEDRSRVN